MQHHVTFRPRRRRDLHRGPAHPRPAPAGRRAAAAGPAAGVRPHPAADGRRGHLPVPGRGEDQPGRRAADRDGAGPGPDAAARGGRQAGGAARAGERAGRLPRRDPQHPGAPAAAQAVRRQPDHDVRLAGERVHRRGADPPRAPGPADRRPAPGSRRSSSWSASAARPASWPRWPSGSPATPDRAAQLHVGPPPAEPVAPLDDYRQKVLRAARRGTVYPYELTSLLAGPDGRFAEYDLDGSRARWCRWTGRRARTPPPW